MAALAQECEGGKGDREEVKRTTLDLDGPSASGGGGYFMSLPLKFQPWLSLYVPLDTLSLLGPAHEMMVARANRTL